MTDAQGYRPTASDPAADWLAQKQGALDMMNDYAETADMRGLDYERFAHNAAAIAKIRASGKRMSERSAMRQILLSGWYAS